MHLLLMFLLLFLLVGTGIHLLWRESALLRRTTLDTEESDGEQRRLGADHRAFGRWDLEPVLRP